MCWSLENFLSPCHVNLLMHAIPILNVERSFAPIDGLNARGMFETHPLVN
jgi:hypothetical protein